MVYKNSRTNDVNMKWGPTSIPTTQLFSPRCSAVEVPSELLAVTEKELLAYLLASTRTRPARAKLSRKQTRICFLCKSMVFEYLMVYWYS